MPWIVADINGQFELIWVAADRVPRLEADGFVHLPEGVNDDALIDPPANLVAWLKRIHEFPQDGGGSPSQGACEDPNGEHKPLGASAWPDGREQARRPRTTNHLARPRPRKRRGCVDPPSHNEPPAPPDRPPGQ